MCWKRERDGGGREGGESSAVEEMSEWEVKPLALMPLGTYIGNGYLHVAPLVGLDFT